MASEPLSHTSNCKQEAKVGAYWIEKVFPSQRAVFRRWSRKQDGQLGAGPVAELWASAYEKRYFSM